MVSLTERAVLWILVFAFWIVGDIGTTVAGLSSGIAHESNALPAVILGTFGIPGLLATKALVAVAIIVSYVIVDRFIPLGDTPTDVFIGLVLLGIGMYATIHNSLILGGIQPPS